MIRTVCAWALAATLCLAAPAAGAQAFVQYTGRVCEDLPPLTLTVTDTGERTDDNNVLSVFVQAQDGSLDQQITWESVESPEFERIVPLARLVDMNADGYGDLVLLAAQGARNVFTALSLWDEEAGRFRPVERARTWDSEMRAFSSENAQLNFCNYELYPQEKRVFSSVADGYRFVTSIVYEWEGRYELAVKAVADIYDAGSETIGETVMLYGEEVTRCWDETYPESWYYGENDASGERYRVIRAMLLEDAAKKAPLVRVAAADGTHLRRQDEETSPSLAKLSAGETAALLAQDGGNADGWARVWYTPEDGEAMTGYIRQSDLMPADK